LLIVEERQIDRIISFLDPQEAIILPIFQQELLVRYRANARFILSLGNFVAFHGKY